MITPTSEAVAGESESHDPTSEPTIPVVTTPEATAQPNPSPTPTPAARAIGAISNSDTGKTMTIAEAGISDIDYFSKGVKYTLTDSTGSITLLLWQNVLEEISDRYSLFPGSQVQVTGEIAEYMDDLEIIPYHKDQVVVLSQGERLPIEERPANGVTPSDEGRIFRVEGVVTWTESRDWFKLWLSDGTGEILIFVPERTVPYLPSGIGMGVRLRVTGEVDIYNSVLEIIPLAGADVEVQ
jgi:DNA/RNA endonuclease YhcR with UshA esterase domain